MSKQLVSRNEPSTKDKPDHSTYALHTEVSEISIKQIKMDL